MPTPQCSDEYPLYWYQEEAVECTLEYFFQGYGKHPLIVLPTGSGKSHVIGKLIRRIINAWPEQNILVVTHREKLIEQDYTAICNYFDKDKVGIYSAGIGKRQRRKICVAGIQSIARKAELFDHYTIAFVDEAHCIPHSRSGQYRTLFNALQIPVVGFTATHYRMGTGYLHLGDKRLFDGIAYECNIELLVELGYLCKLIPRLPTEEMNTNGLHTQGGDFIKAEMSERFSNEAVTVPIIDDLVKYQQCRKWLLFAIDIKHCELIERLLQERGIESLSVHSKQTKQYRATVHELFKNGDVQALVSVETLTTGFDDPDIDLIGLLRPTKSPSLHVQMIGRGLRIAENKHHCLVLDYAGNIMRLGPINDVQVPVKKKKGKGGNPPVKVCPNCRCINHATAKHCVECGHKFPETVSLAAEPGKAEIIRKKGKHDQTFEVLYMTVMASLADSTSYIISFRCTENRSIHKRETISHSTWYHFKRRTNEPKPRTVQELITRFSELIPPSQIIVNTRRKRRNEVHEYVYR